MESEITLRLKHMLGIKNCLSCWRNAAIIAMFSVIFAAFAYPVNAQDIIAVSHLGYHPSSAKQVVVYTDGESGSFDIKTFNTNEIAATYALQKPLDYAGNEVKCQGNIPCIVGGFSDFTSEGRFYIESNGLKSHDFVISKDLYSDTIPIFLEFFNAMLQQNSDYHADLHSNYLPPFKSISDGSFIMEADQAALPLIRLGSSYRKNPGLFQFDKYDMQSSGKPDMQEYILSYVLYLEGLQGIAIKEDDSASAFRLGTGVKIETAFVPGPTNLSSIDVYIPGTPQVFLDNVPVVSLCGPDDGTPEWKKCTDDAAYFYKCQIDEPCLQISYIDKRGVVASNNNGYAVSRGWGYEFGCFFDINLNTEMFNGKPNPCMVFYNDSKREYTAMALLAFLEALPAVNDYSSDKGQELLKRSVDTYNYIKDSYPQFSSADSDSGFFGASLFLLYDYTGDLNYLQEAYKARNSVSTQLLSDATRGNEFYWEEYARHRNAITESGMDYQYNGKDPEEIFRGKIFNDYKDRGPQYSISSNGERVFQFDNNIQFQNSRFLLTEGLLAAKTAELNSNPEEFIPLIADHQLAWLTGMNAVQQGTALDSSLKSMSFIFGIGGFPKQFHSRYLIDTGYTDASNGAVIGARGTNYQFLDNLTQDVIRSSAQPEDYIFFDGKFDIIGNHLGALGNKWRNETHAEQYASNKKFRNGKEFIPGWINGAFDTSSEQDIIYNYDDNINAYEYTETTNEIVATAIELLSYLDYLHNGRLNHSGIQINNTGNISNGENSTLNSTINITLESNLAIHTNPGLADAFLNLSYYGATDSNGLLYIPSLAPGYYELIINKENYKLYSTLLLLNPGQNLSLNIDLERKNSSTSSQNLTQATIINSTTSLGKTSSSPNGAEYYMREDSTATFSVVSNSSSRIEWLVDDVLISASDGLDSTFNWSPGILWAPKEPEFSNIALTTIKAVSGNETVSWKIDVENVVNPFFSSLDGSADSVGSSDAQVNVFTNDRLIDFTNISVTLQSQEGQNVVGYTYPLDKTFEGNNETAWEKDLINLPYGNNYLVGITGFDRVTKNTVTYKLDTERGHYRNFPQNSGSTSNNNNGDQSNSESNGGNPVKALPQLVYATFGKDIIGVNDTQTITLDAKNFNGGIYRVEANLIPPGGPARTIKLQLVGGNKEYGTWSAEFGGFVTGQYVLYSVSLGADESSEMDNLPVENRSFYVIGDAVSANEHLMLVYSVLSQRTVQNGSNVTFRIDARDADGIIYADAKIKTSRSVEFAVPLELVSGNKNYGTWEGNFRVTEPDTTYSVASVSLDNLKQIKNYEIKDRSVYVLPLPQSANLGNAVTGFAAGPFYKQPLSNLMKEPLAPTLVGFGLMLLIIGTLVMGQKIGRRSRPKTVQQTAITGITK